MDRSRGRVIRIVEKNRIRNGKIIVTYMKEMERRERQKKEVDKKKEEWSCTRGISVTDVKRLRRIGQAKKLIYGKVQGKAHMNQIRDCRYNRKYKSIATQWLWQYLEHKRKI